LPSERIQRGFGQSPLRLVVLAGLVGRFSARRFPEMVWQWPVSRAT